MKMNALQLCSLVDLQFFTALRGLRSILSRIHHVEHRLCMHLPAGQQLSNISIKVPISAIGDDVMD